MLAAVCVTAGRLVVGRELCAVRAARGDDCFSFWQGRQSDLRFIVTVDEVAAWRAVAAMVRAGRGTLRGDGERGIGRCEVADDL
jgi:hypothetical protein